MGKIERTVFISYRRVDEAWALNVYQFLTKYDYDIFFDLKSISSGDFEQIIVGNIKARAHFILILTPTALDRCSEPGDWLRREIETAIIEKRNIIPIFFENFSFDTPSVATKLTGELANLKKYNGLEVPPAYFEEAMERLHQQYLSIALDAVLHPTSAKVQAVVKEQQVAVKKELSRRKYSHNIGFISFRFAGTDGVSLETSKWAEVLEEMGHSCYYFSGLSDRPDERSMVVEEAHFLHPEIREHYYRFFGTHIRKPEDTHWIHKAREYFREKLNQFVLKFDVDLLIPENVLSFPQNIPLSMALTELIAETGIPTIAHHHDFTWERKDLLVNSVHDYISMAVPPILPSIQHVVINTHASHQMARRTGVSSTIVPNVMNFEKPAPEVDDYSADLREAIGLEPDEFFILQPTRVVQRKGIEHAIELVSRLGLKARLVISHASGDDGYGYEKRVREYADLLDVRAIFSSQKFDEKRRMTEDGQKVYSLWDAYPHADLITYPSEIEGFGNAFLEALYFKKPIVVNNYAIYETDIKPKGFKVIDFNEYITDETVEAARNILQNPQSAKEMCNYNYKLALKHYSYKVLRNKLRVLLNNAFGINHMP